MKRKISAMIFGVISAAAFGVSVHAAQNVNLLINGVSVETDTPAQITAEGRTIVPLRVISESLGADVAWEQDEKKVLVEKNGQILELKIGEKVIYNDGEAMEIDSPAQIINGRTMVPVRVVSENLGCTVDWDAETKTVFIFPEDYESEGYEEFTTEVVDLPEYHYKGDPAYMETICQYLIDYTRGNYDASSVTIPVPLIAEMKNDDPNDIKVWGGFWVFNYNLDGDILQCVSGGNYPGCLHLRKDGDSYSVTKFDVAQDGENNASSLRKICLNDDARYDKLVKVEERREGERKNLISDYVKANRLKISAYQDYGWDPVYLSGGSSSASVSTPSGTSGNVIEENLPGVFEFSSGAGAWSTNLFLANDGTFSGYYSDTDMGDTGSDYPNGTVHECSFTGSFTNIRKNGNNSYTMTLGTVNTDRPAGEEEIIEGQRHIYAAPYGLESGSEFILYKPETPVSGLSEDFLSWWPARFEEGVTHTNLDCFGIYNKSAGYGFFGYAYDAVEDTSFESGMDLG